MLAIRSVQDAKEAFPQLRWKDLVSGSGGRMAFAIVGGNKGTGDITIFLAMEDGATAPLHRHNNREGWPFNESITVLVGSLYDVDPGQPDLAVDSGRSIDLIGNRPHAPRVNSGGFALVIYRQPAGMELIDGSSPTTPS